MASKKATPGNPPLIFKQDATGHSKKVLVAEVAVPKESVSIGAVDNLLELPGFQHEQGITPGPGVVVGYDLSKEPNDMAYGPEDVDWALTEPNWQNAGLCPKCQYGTLMATQVEPETYLAHPLPMDFKKKPKTPKEYVIEFPPTPSPHEGQHAFKCGHCGIAFTYTGIVRRHDGCTHTLPPTWEPTEEQAVQLIPVVDALELIKQTAVAEEYYRQIDQAQRLIDFLLKDRARLTHKVNSLQKKAMNPTLLVPHDVTTPESNALPTTT